MGDRLEGKATIITGAGSGIGEAAALRFAAEGARVACVDLHDDTATATAEAITAAGGEAIAIAADVGDNDQMEAMAARTLEEFGTIDGLYANAGVAGTGSAASTTLEEWDRVIRINLTGVWLSMRAVLPTMVEAGGGSVVLQASVGGIVGVKGIFPYAAAKAGVIGMTKQAAVEFGPHNIRVNAIAPGTARTPLVDEVYRTGAGTGSVDGHAMSTEEDIVAGLERAAERYPIGRLGTPDEIADLALFLASDESAWITGGTHVIDGGFSVL